MWMTGCGFLLVRPCLGTPRIARSTWLTIAKFPSSALENGRGVLNTAVPSGSAADALDTAAVDTVLDITGWGDIASSTASSGNAQPGRCSLRMNTSGGTNGNALGREQSNRGSALARHSGTRSLVNRAGAAVR